MKYTCDNILLEAITSSTILVHFEDALKKKKKIKQLTLFIFEDLSDMIGNTENIISLGLGCFKMHQ